MTLEDVGLQNITTIHSVQSDQAENYSLNNVSLDNVNLSAVDPTTQSQRTHFYVFCREPCAAMARGKLHVQYSECKNTSFMLFSTPSGRDCVLTTNHMYGRCNDCGENTAKFFSNASITRLKMMTYQCHYIRFM